MVTVPYLIIIFWQ